MPLKYSVLCVSLLSLYCTVHGIASTNDYPYQEPQLCLISQDGNEIDIDEKTASYSAVLSQYMIDHPLATTLYLSDYTHIELQLIITCLQLMHYQPQAVTDMSALDRITKLLLYQVASYQISPHHIVTLLEASIKLKFDPDLITILRLLIAQLIWDIEEACAEDQSLYERFIQLPPQLLVWFIISAGVAVYEHDPALFDASFLEQDLSVSTLLTLLSQIRYERSLIEGYE